MNGFIGSGCGSCQLVRCKLGGYCDCRCGILYAPMLEEGEWLLHD